METSSSYCFIFLRAQKTFKFQINFVTNKQNQWKSTIYWTKKQNMHLTFKYSLSLSCLILIYLISADTIDNAKNYRLNRNTRIYIKTIFRNSVVWSFQFGFRYVRSLTQFNDCFKTEEGSIHPQWSQVHITNFEMFLPKNVHVMRHLSRFFEQNARPTSSAAKSVKNCDLNEAK